MNSYFLIIVYKFHKQKLVESFSSSRINIENIFFLEFSTE